MAIKHTPEASSTSLSKFPLGVLLLTLIAIGVGEGISSYLSSYGTSLFLLGLWVIYPALYLPFGFGLTVVIAVGFWLDVNTPWPLETYSILATSLFVTLQYIRSRLNESTQLPARLLAVAGNALLLILVAILHGKETASQLTYIDHLLVVLAISSVFIFIVTPLWIRLLKQIDYARSSQRTTSLVGILPILGRLISFLGFGVGL